MTTENIIISTLIYNAEYRDKVLSRIKDEYFQDRSIHWTFKIVRDYVTKYTTSPTKEILLAELGNRRDIGETESRETTKFIEGLAKEPQQDMTWLVDITENWCKDTALFNAIYASIEIVENNKSGDADPSIHSNQIAGCAKCIIPEENEYDS
jgi:hypothetical protein